MRTNIAWGALMLLAGAAPAAAEPTGRDWRIGDQQTADAESRLDLRSSFQVEAAPGARVGFGMWDIGPKMRREPRAIDTLQPTRRSKAPGVGLKLAF
jgi:hypothetical protein